jgi:hypothetical protein
VLQPTNLHWDNTNSRLGINSSTPTSRLDINNANAGNTSEEMFRINFDGNWNLNIQQQHVAGSHIQHDIYQRYSGTDFHTMSFRGGSVGIGTTNPLQKLHVNGTAQATTFSGSGASLTALNAGNVSTGTLAVARGGTGTTTSTGTGSVVLSASPTLTGTVTGGTFSGSGASLTALDAGNVSTGTLAVARGGTGAATLTANKVLVGNGTTAVLQPTNLHWDNTNSRLGISSSSPSYKLSIVADVLDGISVGASDTNLGIRLLRGTGDGASTTVYNGALESWFSIAFRTNAGGNVSHLFNTRDGTTYIQGNVGIGTTNPTSKLDIVGDVKVSGNILKSYVGCSVRDCQSVITGTETTLLFTTIDNGSAFYSASTGKFTAPVSGYYHATFTMLNQTVAVVTVASRFGIFKNTTTNRISPMGWGHNSEYGNLTLCVNVSLSANETVFARANYSQGGYCGMTVFLIG